MRGGEDSELGVTLTPTEATFFDRVRAACGGIRETKDPWAEFLKCLELYSSEIVTRTELLVLCSDVLCGAMGAVEGKALLEELRYILSLRGQGAQ
jgi:hypothetical protein